MTFSTLALTLRNPKRRVERDPRFGRKLTRAEQELHAALIEWQETKRDRKIAASDAARKGQR